VSRLDSCFELEDFRRAAQARLPRGLFEFIDRGAERESGLVNNIDAFARLRLKTRLPMDFSNHDLSTEVFGRRWRTPFAIAPTGVAGLCWYRGEMALAKAAAACGVPFVVTSTSITSMEEIAGQSGAELWFQLYPWVEEDDTMALIRKADQLGYQALVITVDWALGRTREYNDRNGFTDPISLNRRFITDMALHPSWVFGVMGRYATTTGFPRHENFPPRFRHRLTSASSSKPRNSQALTWDYIDRIRRVWPRPLLIKGILNPIDARLAVEHGAEGVVVSNHGGRALDSAVATIDILPEIVEAVGSRATVILDSGVRFGGDVVKALALGATAVLVGRPALYGVATGGQAGVEKVLGLLASQYEKNMGYVGCRRVGELGPHIFASARPSKLEDAACGPSQAA
jgi:isopentenyl diphosphate isomerase/L-lactate dehydrogenase-like FMN-dependent dehydrogenase